MPRSSQSKIVKYHLPQVEAQADPEERAAYLADLMAGEGLDPAAAVLVAYCKKHDDGLLVYTLLLKREQEFEGDLGDLLESLTNSLPR